MGAAARRSRTRCARAGGKCSCRCRTHRATPRPPGPDRYGGLDQDVGPAMRRSSLVVALAPGRATTIDARARRTRPRRNRPRHWCEYRSPLLPSALGLVTLLVPRRLFALCADHPKLRIQSCLAPVPRVLRNCSGVLCQILQSSGMLCPHRMPQPAGRT